MKSGAASYSKVDSNMRDAYKRKFPRETIVTGDPL